MDGPGERILVLSKRDIPAVLYDLPLMPGSSETIVATRLREIDSLPQPSHRESADAKGSGWYWQPTGMDISDSGDAALILTYGGIYFYSRDNQQPWHDAFGNRPLGLKLGKYKDAESIAFAPGGDSSFVTTEGKHAPLLHVDLNDAALRAR